MKRLLWILFFAIPLCAFSQIKKSDTLKEVILRERKTEINPTVQTIDSNVLKQYQNTSLQNLLQLHSNVFVKNYGVGALSTISIRGSSSAQTSVLWNGININNAMTGVSDFSTMSVSLFDEIKINYGSSTPNVVGGNIELNNEKPYFRNKREDSFTFGAGYESLQNTSISMTVKSASFRYYYRVKVFAQQAKNIYDYYNSESGEYETLTHAKSTPASGILDFFIRIKNNKILSLHSWNTITEREIPPTIFEKESAKKELNSSNRFLIKYDYKNNRYASNTSLGFIHDQLKYEDSLISFKNTSLAVSVPFTETVNIFPLSRQKISVQYNATLQKLLAPTTEHLLRTSLAVHYEMDPVYKKLWIKSFIQKELTNVFSLPLVAGVSIKQKIYRENFLFASLASNYRTPTLNELYFTPGGNKNLKPETSKNLEGGMENNLRHDKHSLKATTTLFSRDVQNWIVWYGGSILTPHNIQRVRSRGLEMDLSYRCLLSDVRCQESPLREVEITNTKPETCNPKLTTFNINVLYAYTLSTTKESAIANDYSVDKQIPYVPRYQAKLNLGFTHNSFNINYVYAYTGYRFVTTDESEYLLPYNTHNIFASYSLSGNAKRQLFGTFKVNNILNKSYESIVGRVMPCRNFSVGLSCRLSN